MTEFTNLAVISNTNNNEHNVNRHSSSSENSLENCPRGKQYKKVSLVADRRYSNGLDTAVVSGENEPRIEGHTITFHGLKYTIEEKIKRKKVTKDIVKGIR